MYANEGKTDEEIFFTDYKEYDIGGKKISIGCVNAYDEETARDLAGRMRAVMPSAQPKTGTSLLPWSVSCMMIFR